MSLFRQIVVVAASITMLGNLGGQEQGETAQYSTGSTEHGAVEELKVVGQSLEEETDVESERILLDVQSDFIDTEFISRVGDSDAAALLRRMPGLTLAQSKYVYVRGLGERYSSAQLNGSSVPSPDITRNVIPLDIFPADIIDSISVQKGYSPERSASFGGGNIDIRTKRVPTDGMFHVELKTGINSRGGDGLIYPGGDDDNLGVDDGTRALSPDILATIDRYSGSLSPVQIFRTPVNSDPPENIDQARQINKEVATFLNRDFDFSLTNTGADLEGELLTGYRFYLTDRLDVGVLALGSYSNDYRNRERIVRRVTNPMTDFVESLRTTHEVNLTGTLNFGLQYLNDHRLGSIHLLLRNTEDDAVSTRTCSQGQFNDCFDESNARQGRIYGMRYEQREMEMHQFNGSHTLGDETLVALPEVFAFIREGELEWYYTFAIAATSLPHEVSISGQELLDSPNGLATEYSVRTSATVADLRYSDLSDHIETHGWDFTLPLHANDVDVELSAGYDTKPLDRGR